VAAVHTSMTLDRIKYQSSLLNLARVYTYYNSSILLITIRIFVVREHDVPSSVATS
jgi:hypothetical protein